MLRPPTVVLVVLSARSTAVPVTDWLAPLVSSTSPLLTLPLTPVQLAMPDCTVPASAQVNLTVTGVLYQPAGFGLVVAAPVMVGAVLSSLTVSASFAGFVATSWTWPLMAFPLVSVVHRPSQ